MEYPIYIHFIFYILSISKIVWYGHRESNGFNVNVKKTIYSEGSLRGVLESTWVVIEKMLRPGVSLTWEI